MKRLLIVRHGDTFLPDEPPRRIGARTDLPLTPRGEAQARAVAVWLSFRDLVPEHAMSGPLRRAVDTARIILAAVPSACSLHAADWLNEVDFGPDEGNQETKVVERIGREALERWDRLGEPARGWPIDRTSKIAECRGEIERLPKGTSLLVTSNGTARFLLLALGLTGSGTPLKLRTGAIGEIEITDEHARLCCWDVRPQ